MNLLRASLAGAAAFLVTSAVVPAISHADTLTFALTSDHCTNLCGPQATTFGSISVTDAGGGVDLTLTLFNGNKLISGGIGGAFDFAFDLSGNPTVTYSALSGFSAPVNPQSAGSIMFDGFGQFEYGLACATCGSGGGGGVGGTFSVHISNITTASFESNGDAVFVVDIISGTTGNTGAVDASVAVPGPIVGAGLPGLVMACGGLLALGRRRRRQLAT